jgi:hypothetical protein
MAALVRERHYNLFTFGCTSTLVAASPENSHLCARCSPRCPHSGEAWDKFAARFIPHAALRRPARAARFPPRAASGVYHSFPALFCAGDSRIVEGLFVT